MATLRPSVQKCFIYGTIMKRKKSTHFTQQGIQNEIKKILKIFAYQQLPFRRKPRSFERWEHPRSLHRCICQTCWFPLEILLHDSHLTLLSATMNLFVVEKKKWKFWIHKMSKNIFQLKIKISAWFACRIQYWIVFFLIWKFPLTDIQNCYYFVVQIMISNYHYFTLFFGESTFNVRWLNRKNPIRNKERKSAKNKKKRRNERKA